MRQAEVNPRGAQAAADFIRLSLKDEVRSSPTVSAHIHIQPADSSRPPCAQRLEKSLLCRKAGGIMRHGIAVRATVVLLRAREDPSYEPVRLSLDHFAETGDLYDVHSNSYYHLSLPVQSPPRHPADTRKRVDTRPSNATLFTA